MATLLDLTILQYLTPLFTFLFILIISYAILDKFKLLGDKVAPKLLAAFSVSMLFIFSKEALNVINMFTPWVLVLAIAGFLLIAVLMFWGAKEESVMNAVTKEAFWPIFIVVILFLVVVITVVFQDTQSPYDQSEDKTRTSEGFKTIFHPRILGAILILVIALFAISNVSKGLAKKG